MWSTFSIPWKMNSFFLPSKHFLLVPKKMRIKMTASQHVDRGGYMFNVEFFKRKAFIQSMARLALRGFTSCYKNLHSASHKQIKKFSEPFYAPVSPRVQSSKNHGKLFQEGLQFLVYCKKKRANRNKRKVHRSKRRGSVFFWVFSLYPLSSVYSSHIQARGRKM